MIAQFIPQTRSFPTSTTTSTVNESPTSTCIADGLRIMEEPYPGGGSAKASLGMTKFISSNGIIRSPLSVFFTSITSLVIIGNLHWTLVP